MKINEIKHEIGLVMDGTAYKGIYIDRIIVNTKTDEKVGKTNVFSESSGDFIADFDTIMSRFMEYREAIHNLYTQSKKRTMDNPVLEYTIPFKNAYNKHFEWENIGSKLKDEREKRGLTIADVAKSLGTSSKRIKNFEAGLPVTCASSLERTYYLYLDWTDNCKKIETISALAEGRNKDIKNNFVFYWNNRPYKDSILDDGRINVNVYRYNRKKIAI